MKTSAAHARPVLRCLPSVPGPDYRLALTEIPRPIPGKGEILIKVAAAGINRADLHQAHGAYPPPPGAPETLGMEVSGRVAALGDGPGPYKTGDAVCSAISSSPPYWL